TESSPLILKATETDGHGAGALPLLPACDYQLTASLDGYETVSLKPVMVSADRITLQRIRMREGGGEVICVDGCNDPCWGMNHIDTTSSSVNTHLPLDCYGKFAN